MALHQSRGKPDTSAGLFFSMRSHSKQKKDLHFCKPLFFAGTGSETWTRKRLPSADFESAASTNSTIPADWPRHMGNAAYAWREWLCSPRSADSSSPQSSWLSDWAKSRPTPWYSIGGLRVREWPSTLYGNETDFYYDLPVLEIQNLTMDRITIHWTESLWKWQGAKIVLQDKKSLLFQ